MEEKTVKGFTLVTSEKVDRALHGTTGAKGVIVGGIMKPDGTYDEAALLAEYDRLGGLITKNGDKVKTGSFYDFKNRKPFEKPNIVFVYKVNDRFIEVPEGVELPGEVKAARILAGGVEEEVAFEDEAPKKVKKAKK